MMKLCLRDVLGQPREEGLGLEWQLVSLMEGDQVVSNARDIHQVRVGGVWGQVGDTALVMSAGQMKFSLWAFQRVWAVKLWDIGMAFIWSVVYRPVAHQRCQILIPRTCECVT